MLEPLVAALITSGTRLLTGVRARWPGSGPSPAQRIYFANHTSHMDFVLVWSALPPGLRAKTRPVAAGDYWSETALRQYVGKQVFRGVLLDRAGTDRAASPIAPMLEALDHGESLILFPEGTRGSGAALAPFKAGIYHVARERPGVELAPVWIENSHRVMPKGSLLPVPQPCRVTFGRPIHLQPDEEKEAFLNRLRGNLLTLKPE